MSTPQSLHHKKKSFIHSTVKLHDKSQIEAIFDYSLFSGLDTATTPQRVLYDINAYFFIPAEIGLKKETYTKETFYNDIRPLIRLREPNFGFHDLIGEEKEYANLNSPLVSLSQFFSDTTNGTMDDKIERAINDSLLFACVYSGYLNKRFRRLKLKFLKLPKLSKELALDEAKDIIVFSREVVGRAYTLLKKLREFGDFCPQFAPATGIRLKLEITNAEAFCSYKLRDFLTDLGDLFEESKLLFNTTDLKDLRHRTLALLRKEKSLFAKRGHIWISHDSNEQEKELYLLRRRFLKKHVRSILYLNVRQQPMLAFKRQVAAMIAAGIAMAWYVGVQFAVMANTQFNVFSFSFFNITSVLVMSALILAYILKDRIKELMRSKFSPVFLGDLPDHFEKIIYQQSTKNSIHLGNLREYASLKPFSVLPVRIRKKILNLTGYSTRYLQDFASFIHYQKKIDLHHENLKTLQHKYGKIHDIMRINVQTFLSRLDDVTHTVRVIETNGAASEISIPKNYHIDLILNYAIKIHNKTHKMRSVYIRLILNKEGLVRLDNLSHKIKPNSSIKSPFEVS